MKKINAKVLPYALVLSLSTASLTACAGNENFTYSIDSTEGNINVEGTIGYNNLSSYKLIELSLVNGEKNIYIVKISSGRVGTTYFDIFTGYKIFADYDKTSEIKLINTYDLKDYLVTYDEIKGSYTIEDVERIYDKIKEDYIFNKEKTNSK